MNIIIFSLLVLVSLLELLYILFRNPNLNMYNKYILSITVVAALCLIVTETSFYKIIRLISVITLLTANVKFKHPDYEKPDYRYLLILLGTIFINMI